MVKEYFVQYPERDEELDKMQTAISNELRSHYIKAGESRRQVWEFKQNDSLAGYIEAIKNDNYIKTGKELYAILLRFWTEYHELSKAAFELWNQELRRDRITFMAKIVLCGVIIEHDPIIPAGMYEPVFSQEELDVRMSHHEY